MAYLDKKNIEFIDNYLKNSGVIFIDIRLEMVDHIASAIEGKMEKEFLNFYDAFKAYMAVNKKELIKSGTSFRWNVDKKILKKLVRNLFSKYILFLIGILLFLNYYLKFPLLEKQSAMIIVASLMAIFIFSIIIYKRSKISFLNRLLFIGFFFNYLIVHQVFLSQIVIESKYAFGAYIFIIWVNLSLVKTSFDLCRYYKNQYLTI